MTRYLLDTNMLGHFINRRKGVYERARLTRSQGALIGTCLPVVGEMFFGVEYSASREKNRQRLIRALSRLRCWPFDRKAAEEFGRLAAELKRSGHAIQQIDIQVAAIARTLGECTVVTSDNDFSHVSGLAVENWVS
jgi:tRNA(fMet)-specific endonuclease VapC